MNKISDSDREEIKNLLREYKLSYDAIAERFSVSKNAIYSIAKKSGLCRDGLPRVHKRPTELTPDYLRSILRYDPETGIFTWIQGHKKGKVAGWTDERQYVHVRVGPNKLCLAHRLAWFYVHGRWPPEVIDHINGDPSDNRLSNLRECTQAQNVVNSKIVHSVSSIRKGVMFDKKRGRYRAYIRQDGRHKHLGRFKTLEEAVSARKAAEDEIHGEFARRE